MDVNKLQKINQLALELKQKGIASSMDEAVRMAEKMIGGDKEVSGLQSTSEAQKEESTEDNLQLRKINYKLKEHEDIIIQIQNKMNEMITEINKLQNQRPVSKGPVKVPEEKQTIFTGEKPKEKPKNRSGDYGPGDIDINEYFYSGSKRKV